nr:ribonuclease H-like domain-containing protein [Tanacetum cinerariifolium]
MPGPVQFVPHAQSVVNCQFAMPAQHATPAQQVKSTQQVTPGQPTNLPHAYPTGTLHDPDTWNMDTGASSHLNNSVSSLSIVFNTCMYPSISIGDGHSIAVTNTGHNILPTPLNSLHLNIVLITPHIIKNLIFVRQFVRDNNCTIEFDAFGFSVKDFMTRRHMWHQRLGHPGRKVLHHLVFNNFISCNKEKPSVLCHACQLGKHTRHQFSEIRSFQCYHRGEFDNRNLHKLFADNGIQFCLSRPKTSQQNDSPVWNKPITLIHNTPIQNHPDATQFPTTPQQLLPAQVQTTENQAHSRPPSTSAVQQHMPTPTQSPVTQNKPVAQSPIIIPDPSENPNPVSVHLMVTRFRFGTNRPNGMLSRYKARLVVNGSTQLEGVDVDETFSPVVKPGIIRTAFSLATSRHWPIHQLDVKNAFLHGDLSKTVYMHQPLGFRDSIHPDYVCLLQRSLYGLKQAPRAWFQRFASYITRVGFVGARF